MKEQQIADMDISVLELADELNSKFQKAAALKDLDLLVVQEAFERLDCEAALLCLFSRKRMGIVKLASMASSIGTNEHVNESEVNVEVTALKNFLTQTEKIINLKKLGDSQYSEIAKIFNSHKGYLPSKRIENGLLAFLATDSIPFGMLIVYNKRSSGENLDEQVVSLAESEFTNYDEKIFQLITMQARNIYRSLKRYYDIKKINEVGVTLSSSKNTNEVLKVLTDAVLKVFDADIVTLHLYSQKLNDFIGLPFAAGTLFEPQFVNRKPQKGEVAFQVVESKENYYAHDAMNDPIISRSNEPVRTGTKAHFVFREKIQSSAAILLKAENDVVGVMFVNFRRSKSFPIEENNLMEVFAAHAAIAIKNALNKEQLTNKLTFSLSKLTSIRERAINSLIENDDVPIYEIVLEAILALLDAQLGVYVEVNVENRKFVVKTASEPYKKFIGASWSINQGITGHALHTREIQIVYDAAKDDRFLPIEKIECKSADRGVGVTVKSSISIPLILDNKVHGVFHVDSTSLESFSEYDKLILNIIIDQAAKSIREAKLLEEKNLLDKKLDELKKLDHLIGSTWNLEGVLKFVVKTAVELTKQERVIGIIDLIENIDGKSYLVPYATSGVEAEKKPIPLDGNETIARLAVVENRTINVTATDEIWRQNYSVLVSGMLSELAVPLRIRNKPIGVIYVESPDPQAFDKEDEKFLETLAGQVVLVIQMTRFVNDIKTIGSAGLTYSRNGFLNLILSKAEELIGADLVAIWLFDKTTKKFELGGYSGAQGEILRDLNLSIDNSFSGLTLKQQKILVGQIDEPLDSSMTASRQSFKILESIGMKSIISVPFIAEDAPVGIMSIHTKERIDIERWEKSWVKSLLELFAAQASIALQNFQRYSELQEAKNEIEQSVNKIIFDNMRQMLRLVTHRMNNSVGNIRADIIDLLDTRGVFDKKSVKKLEAIKEAAQEALGIPIELDNFVKKLKSDKTEVHIYDVIQDILKDKETKKITVFYDSLKKVPSVKANQGLLKEVFGELIQNAMKAMPDGGEILISAQTAKSQMLEIQVKDTGHGIAKENLGKIFEYGHTHWKNARGSGDGLSIIKTVIEVDHKGKISVESEEGKGCTVKLSLPLFEKALF